MKLKEIKDLMNQINHLNGEVSSLKLSNEKLTKENGSLNDLIASQRQVITK